MHFGESFACSRYWTSLKVSSNLVGALRRSTLRRVNLDVIDTGDMNFTLPAADVVVQPTLGTPRLLSSLDNDLYRTTNSYEEDGQAAQAPCAVEEDASRHGVGIVMTDIHNDVYAHPTMGCDRFVHRRIEHWNERFYRIGQLSTRAQTDSWIVPL